MNEQPTISVAILTYKQEKTIRQTLNSVICQKGDFSLEVIIGDDHSPDGNRAICEEFASKYPFGGRVYVKLLPDEPNKGIMGNFARIMKHCTGDYVAICAGDDYWCDEYKLQKQLNYFSIYPDVGVVSTSGYKLLVRSNKLIPNAIAPYQPFPDGDVRKFYFSPDYKGGVYAMPLTLPLPDVTLSILVDTSKIFIPSTYPTIPPKIFCVASVLIITSIFCSKYPLSPYFA